jgi:murein DD-endopeptidase MepM/ murein hydrolase activator NlpD
MPPKDRHPIRAILLGALLPTALSLAVAPVRVQAAAVANPCAGKFSLERVRIAAVAPATAATAEKRDAAPKGGKARTKGKTKDRNKEAPPAPAPTASAPAPDEEADLGDGETVELVAVNHCHVPFFVSLSFKTMVRMKPSAPLPVETIVWPGMRVPLVQLIPEGEGISSYDVQVHLRIGTKEAKPDDSYRYSFPFGGPAPAIVAQGVDGKTTHRGEDRYAFDFTLADGTPVLAARRGIVFQTVDGHAPGVGRGEGRENANLVSVLQEDGTFAEYVLLRQGLTVHPGDAVPTGAVLGYSSGAAGLNTRQHLHFAILKEEADGRVVTVPITFTGDVVPEQGKSYGPGVPLVATKGEAAPPGKGRKKPRGRAKGEPERQRQATPAKAGGDAASRGEAGRVPK